VDLDLGLSEVIGDRALHAEPRVVAALARRIAAGAKRAGMATTAKHFPTHAGARSDSHTEFAVDRREYEALADDLLPYRELIANGLQAVMIAHVSFPTVDETPASLSKWWIEDQLRRALGFSGAVITDDVSMVGAAVVGSVEERVRRALDAGCDLVLLCNSPSAVPGVLDAIKGYVNPSAQLRLTRLHGRGGADWDTLRASAEWRKAQAAVAPLCTRPALELEG
jgi:beta-N-acetylhexosaminidase